MPIHNPVVKLKTLSISTIATAIINSFDKDNDVEYEQVISGFKVYLSVLPVSVRELLLHTILDLEMLTTQVRFWALYLLLSHKMKVLSVGIFPDTYFSRVTEIIHCQGIDLEYLNLRGMWLNGLFSCELQKLLRGLTKLRELIIPHMATDAVLKTIGQCNGSLHVLDIRGECSVTETGIESLCNRNGAISQNLKIVLLGNPGGAVVPPEAVAIIIKCLPNLQSLGSYPNVGRAIECLLGKVGESDIQTNLTYLRDSHTDLKRIELLIKAAPKLEYVYLDHPCDDVIAQLDQFCYIKKVKFGRFKVGDLYMYIEKTGSKILSLELLFGSGVLDLSLLAKRCQNLSELFCEKMEYIHHFDTIEFGYLRSIQIFYSDISTSCVKYIMRSTPNIEILYLGDILEITDEDIIEIFTTRQFNNLTYILFPSAVYLTAISAQVLIQCCPHLSSLGDLSGWNLTDVDINDFRETIVTNNLNLRL